MSIRARRLWIWGTRSIALALLTIPAAALAAVSVGNITAHSPDDLAGFTTLSGTDATSPLVTLPFSISIDGISYSTLVISTNGWIEFGNNTSGNSDPTNDCLPSPAHSNPLLAVYWDDMTTFGTNIRYTTVGSTGGRVFIVDFNFETATGGGAENDIAAQVQIHEGSQVVSVRYRNTGSGVLGNLATIGFQGAGAGAAQALPLICNGRVLDDNQSLQEGFSVHLGNGRNTMHAIMAHSSDDITGFATMTGDNNIVTVPLPFNVTVEGASYSNLAISTNGWVELGGNTAGDTDPSNDCLPTSAHTNPFLAAFWDDLVPEASNVRYGVVGQSPNRVYIVDWEAFISPSPDSSNDAIRVQLQIHETSNVMNVKYRDAQRFADGQTATIGFQGAGGGSSRAHGLTCNGKILDDNTQPEGWSVHARSNGTVGMHAYGAHSPDDITGFTAFTGTDNVATASLGFNLVIDGVTYTNVALSTNGWLEFGGNTSGNSDPANVCLPTSTHTNPFLAAYWDDMITPGAQNIRYGTVGTAGNRVFIAEFFLATQVGGDDGNDDIRFQVQVHEGSNVINVKYWQEEFSVNGQAATIGFQGAGGASAAAHSLGCNAKILDDNRYGEGFSVSPLPICGNGIVEALGGEQCDLGGSNGSATSCCTSACLFRSSGQTCRTAAGECDNAETCTGALATCPADGVKSNGTSCTDDGNVCTNDQCNGSSVLCQHPNNTVPCSDGLFCNGNDTCSGGSCIVHAGDPCSGPDGDADCSEVCDEGADNCNGNDPDLSACAGNGMGECSGADVCIAGACQNNDVAAGTSCTDTSPPGSNNPNQCRDAQCNGAGVCDQTFANESNGTSCADGDFCTTGDVCSGGVCSTGGGSPCDGPDGDGDCSETCVDTGFESGNCDGNDPAASSCDDGLFCTQTDSCNGSGTCVGTGDPCPGADGDINCAESCDESADNCLGNDPDGSSCRPSAGPCDTAETCSAGSCPSDAFQPSGTVCNAGSADLCDPDEVCDGASAPCPSDSIAASGTVCNTGSGDLCDQDEVCSGVADQPCPSDTVASSSTECRTSAGPCDIAESCTGTADEACPSDTFQPSGFLCNAGSGDLCDPDEVCDGATAPCPNDTVAAGGTVCNAGSGDLCDPDEVCSGTADQPCPSDTIAAGDTICNPGSGDLCDPDEVCSGAADQACPSDNVASSGTECRASAGDCDLAESCSGTADQSCPSDGFQPNSVECRSVTAGDLCDEAEYCTGSGASCPADAVKPNTQECRASAGDCDSAELCDGVGKTCPSDTKEPATTECRGGAGICDIAENCDGVSDVCPADQFQADTVSCRGTTTAELCDEEEFCTGSGPDCPTDGVKANGSVCRAGIDVCDASETCDGASVLCPGDGLEPSGTPCRVAAGECDQAETCNGSSTACPADTFQPSGTACGSNANSDCDNPDTCNGSNVCLTNNEANGTSCDDSNACTGSDTCQIGVCVGGSDLCPDLDHYKCYQGKDLKTPKFLKQVGIETDDQLVNDELVDVKKLKFVCAPVDKNGEGINNPSAHLACYQLKAPQFGTRPKVEVSTQFQTSQFEIKKAKLLCVPATKTVLP